jgi:hypothetical protein
MGYAFVMVIRGLLLVAALAPVIGVNLAYWIGVTHDNLPSCIPYIDGCTSISSTGRYPPGDRLFRAVMLPQAVLLAVTWYATLLWLRAVRPDATRAATTALVAGLLGALALIIYVSYLASNDPFYEVMRRYGIYFYFICTVIAQIAVSLVVPVATLRRVMLGIMVTPFALGLLNFVQKAIVENPDRTENVIEWIVSLLMQLWFVVLWLAWRRTHLAVDVKARLS